MPWLPWLMVGLADLRTLQIHGLVNGTCDVEISVSFCGWASKTLVCQSVSPLIYVSRMFHCRFFACEDVSTHGVLDLTGLFGLHCFGSSDQVSCNSFKSLSTWQISCVHSTFRVTGADAAAPRWLAAAFCGFPEECDMLCGSNKDWIQQHVGCVCFLQFSFQSLKATETLCVDGLVVG